MTSSPWLEHNWVAQSELILRSFRHWLGRDLIEGGTSLEDQAGKLFEAPFVVVSHGTQLDPVLNYGNRTALSLWEMNASTFLKTPSRYTAEPVHRDERARLLERTTRNGYVDDYSGIRISSTGRRFRIDQAIVWNLIHEDGTAAGQAATFREWFEVSAGMSPKENFS